MEGGGIGLCLYCVLGAHIVFFAECLCSDAF